MSDEARAEAERRWPEPFRRSDRLPIDWLNEGMSSGFVLGSQWQAGRDAERIAELEAEAERLRRLTEAQAERSAENLARAEAAEAKIEVVRAYCTENTAGMPDDPFAYGIQELRRVLAVLDGEES